VSSEEITTANATSGANRPRSSHNGAILGMQMWRVGPPSPDLT
jgi:hypothetical protein